jgi:hypothetical protein
MMGVTVVLNKTKDEGGRVEDERHTA